MARKTKRHPRPRGHRGVDLHRADDHHPGAVPARADRHGVLGEPDELEGQRRPVRRSGPTPRSSALKNYTVAVHQGRPDPHHLHAVDRQHVLLRAARRAAADRRRARARAGRQQQAAQGQGLLPHGVLLPVGDQLDRHLDGLPLPLLQHRRRQRAAPASSGIDGPQWFSDSRGLLHIVLRLVRRRGQPLVGRRARSSAARCGTGCPGRRWRCASSSSSPSGRPRAPSC